MRYLLDTSALLASLTTANGLIDRALVTDQTHEFGFNRIASHERYMEDIRSSFPHVRAVVTRLEHEI